MLRTSLLCFVACATSLVQGAPLALQSRQTLDGVPDYVLKYGELLKPSRHPPLVVSQKTKIESFGQYASIKSLVAAIILTLSSSCRLSTYRRAVLPHRPADLFG